MHSYRQTILRNKKHVQMSTQKQFQKTGLETVRRVLPSKVESGIGYD